MVGHRGIEPRITRVSGRPRRPAGSWPAEGGGVDPPGVTLRRLSRPVAAPEAHLPKQRAEVPSPTASRRPPVFETEPATRQVYSPWRKTEYSKLGALRPPLAFQAVTAPWRLHPPGAEGGAIEAHGVTRASLSGRARHACPVHLPWRPSDSDRDHTGFGPAGSANWPRAPQG
jgi:hypothetical protein